MNRMQKLKQRQNLFLEEKERLTEMRIIEWYEYWEGNVYVSFSGGKDSTVLLHQVRKLYKDIPAVFIDTGLEYPEIREFVKTIDNVIWLKPKMPFHKIIEKYGYPIISKQQSLYIEEYKNTKSSKLKNYRWDGDKDGNYKIYEKWKYLVNAPFKISNKCCYYLKKEPAKRYERKSNFKPFLGTMASESILRKSDYLKYGCNSFNTKRPFSQPMSFWGNKDVWNYLDKYGIDYSEIYKKEYNSTGCMFCLFGIHNEKEPNRFQKMKKTHPKQYNYCINRLGCGKVLDYINVKY